MNKTPLAFLFFMTNILNFSLSADEVVYEPGLNKSELRAAAFVPTSNSFRDIYGNVGLSLQVEQAQGFSRVKNLEVWENIEWIFIDGSPGSSCGSSDIDILNVSFGVKGIGKVYHDWIYLYAGIGPDLGIVWVKNKINCCDDCDSNQTTHDTNFGVGGVLKTGCQLFVSDLIYFDFFADYLYLPVWFSHTTKDLGGLKAGGGLSFRY